MLAKTLKLMNEEVGINGEAGKKTAIRNFIEIKSSNDLVKISTKRTREIKVVYLRKESLPNLSLYMLINAMLKVDMYIKQFCGFA